MAGHSAVDQGSGATESFRPCGGIDDNARRREDGKGIRPMRLRRRSRLAAIATTILVCAGLAGGIQMAGGQSQEKADVDEKLRAAEERLRAKRGQETVLSEEVAGYTSRIRVLEARLAPLRARAERLRAELAELRQRLDALTGRLDVERARLANAEDTLRRRRVLLATRLRDLYVRGEPDPVMVLFESGSLAAAADTAEILERVVEQDRGLVNSVESFRNEVRATRDRIAGVRAEVAAAEARAERATEEADAAKAALERQKAGLDKLAAGRRQLLGRVQGDRREIEAEAQGLRARSEKLRQKILAAQGISSTPGPSGFVSGGTPSAAGFIWPVNGPITSGFGPRWGRMHEGIDVSGGSGTPIAAAASGTVIVAGWNGGYGQLVVVDHGGGLSTAYAHLSSIAVSVGQGVGQGSVVGGMGTTGHSTGVHLHFEVRVNGGAVNPIGYL